jgi:sugar lactone lactonase YvrE
VDLSAEEGMPDGMTIDGEGLLWVAMWGGSTVLRCSPDGDVVQRLPLPCSQPTSCAFGGDDLATLFITTARYGLDDAQLADEPMAGGLLACRPGVTGPAAVPLALR